MRITMPQRNQQAKHYLLKWYYLDENVEYLTDAEMIKMKILYVSLKELSEDELYLLSMKYRQPGRLTDKDAALNMGIDAKVYRDKRVSVELKLKPFIERNMAEY